MKFLIVLLLVASSLQLNAQNTFSDTRFFEIVLKNHPLAKQANLAISFGENSVLKAKGGFDPKVYNQIDQKYYNSSQYYSMVNAGLKVPTWFGLEIKSGIETNRGTYLSPQEKTPTGGLWYGGVSMSLGQGLMIDQRRAELFKAKLFQQSTLFEQKLQLNELIYESGYSYWNWFLSYHSTQVLNESYNLAVERFNAVKRTAELGDRPFIDTLEAQIQVQNRESLLRSFEADYKSMGYKLETFLWDENLAPLELESSTTPIDKDTLLLELKMMISDLEIDSAIANHPYLQITNYKIKSLEVEKRLKKENLKPQLNLQYNLINEPINYNPLTSVSLNNYKWGLTFEMPIFLRKERGDLALADLKIQEEQYNYQNNQAYLEYKIKNAIVEFNNASAQVEIYRRTVEDTKNLLVAEKTMFESGESSLFLINAREITYIQAQLKLIEGIVKSKQALLSLKFSLANLI